MTTPSEIQLDLLIVDKDADPERLDELTVRVMRDLRELGAESVERLAGEEIPEGAKGDPFTIGALALVAVPAVLPALVSFLQGWSLRGESRQVRIKTPAGLEVEFTPEKKMSQQDVPALVEQLTSSRQAIDHAPQPVSAELGYHTQLRQLLAERLNEAELRTLCFDLGAKPDNFPGDSKADKERELIEYLKRRDRIPELLALGKRLRPDTPWDSLPTAARELRVSTKPLKDEPVPVPTTPAVVEQPEVRAAREPRRRPLLPSGTPIPWSWIAGAVELVVVALIVFVLVLTGCGGEEAEPSDTPTTAVDVIIPSTDTPQLTSTPEPTDTVTRPTGTPEATVTATSQPTDTPTSTDTATPRPTDTLASTEVPTLGIDSTMARERDSAVMVYVPGGTFQMGSSEAEIDTAFEQCEQNVGSGECSRDLFERESPKHTVTLVSFWIDKYEVTNAQYRQCVEDGACRAPTTCDWGEPTYEDESKADHPVICVDWDGAKSYCEWADSRLPTEAEWEYAARGPEGCTYPRGNTFDGEQLNFCDANCPEDWKDTDWDDGYELTAPVGSFEDGASWCGALNMAGNVWEWVNDWYQEDYYSVSPVRNPTGPETGDVKVVRGGSWYSYAYHVRSADRGRYDPVDSVSNLGFRCVGDLTP